MKLVLLLCAVSLVLSAEQPSSEKGLGYHKKFGIPEAQKIRLREAVSSRVLGGIASFPGEDPFLAGLIVNLTNGETSVCAGTLLNRRKVLTAAQCWYDGYHQGQKITVVLGSITLFSGGVRQNVYSVVAHPQFDPYELVNDLAMLTIPGVSYNMYLNPASLPVYQQNSSFVGETVKTIGYGIINDGAQITEDTASYGVYVPVITNQECNDSYTSTVDNNTICTSGANKWGPCNGDGGAPLIYSSYPGENMLIGVYSFHGTNGCESGLPFGYMRVTAYLSWIQNLMY